MAIRILVQCIVIITIFAGATTAQPLTEAERSAIDSGVKAALEATGSPGASIAIVRGGQIVYENAYGIGRIEPQRPARSDMRYAIGSVSKQFTAAAILLLQEDGKLSLDDHVSKWFPQLTRAGDISIRRLLSMTSGYQDYWPQDYVFMDMQRPTPASEIMQRWAAKPLDFDPGTKWQYSNTNYVIAAAIVERVAGMPFMRFLQHRIFTPLKMTSVVDFDAGPLGPGDAQPLLRHALGPFREAPKEAKGWLFGAGQLAMTAHDLSLWNISMMNQSLLKPASYKVLQTEMLLESGNTTGYGLGVQLRMTGERRRIVHGGAVSGYTTTSQIFPDDKAAIVAYTNIYPGAANAPGMIADRITRVIFAEPPANADALAQAQRIYAALMKGAIDRSLFTPSANAFFTAEVLADYATTLGPLGAPTEFTAAGEGLRGGMVLRGYRVRAGGVLLSISMMSLPDGKIDQFIVSRAG
ncbi:MAG TPA: serine hydrolase domain-containing protein [Vicinamibacterales bacterium]|nr:serine hydrolase domain-containing protein [Vicinamibacterales bacterium]